MVTAQDAFLLAFGVLACFMGYSMFRDMLPLWGFVLGGWITYTLLPTVLPLDLGSEFLYALATFAIGGVIGAIIATPLYFVMVFLSGGVLGMLVGIMAGALVQVGGVTSVRQINEIVAMSFPPIPQTGIQFLLMAIFGIILGGLALNFQKFMICASSAFIGAAAIISGLGGPITQLGSADMGRGALALAAWMVLGLIGLYVQYRVLCEV